MNSEASVVSQDNYKSPAPFELVKTELEEVRRRIAEQAEAFDKGISSYMDYICAGTGKMIRPALALMSGMATSNEGSSTEEQIKLGQVLELIHMASLVHDDILDEAQLRRALPTASAKWGGSLSVLLGDALFAHALVLATEFDDMEVCRAIAKAAREVCSGEILQTQRRYDMKLSDEEYFRIIEMKTAALFAVATEQAAALNGASLAQQASLREYGNKLGIVYQIYDDCLDLVGDPESSAKTLRTDLEKGKLTLPVLNLLRSASEKQKEKISRILLDREPLELSMLAGIADYEGAIEQAIDTARDLCQSARDELIGLEENAGTEALHSLALYLEGLLDRCRL